MGKLSIYATPTKKLLSHIAIIDEVARQEILGEGLSITPEQINQIVDTVSQSINIDSKVDKETGKGLSTNDYITDDKNKLTGIESGAQVNANITKTEIESKLIGVITSHSHEGGGGGLTQQQIEGFI
jgi:hypothetical protein